jgi:TolB protein
MANAKTPGSGTALPDWWQREKQQRQIRILIGLLFVLALIGYYYWESGRPKAYVTIGGDIPDPTNYIAFVRQDKNGNTDIYALRADGGSLHRLTDPDDKSGKETPIWAPDGSSLYYVTNRKDNRTWQVYTLGGGEFAQFTYGTGNKSAPTMSPDGKSMAFIAQGAIKTVELKGKDPPFQLLPPPDNGASAGEDNSTSRPVQDPSSNIPGPFRSVVLSADGRGCAGVKAIGGGDDSIEAPEDVELGNEAVFAIPPGSDKSVMLSTGREVSAAWDPKGTRVACSFTEFAVKRPDGKTELNSGIMVWGLDNPMQPSEQPLLLTRGFSDEPRNIAWSPDGTRMAFEVWQAKSEDDRELKGIAVMDVNLGNAARPVMRYMIQATPDAKQQHPVWSPDGSRLLYEVVRKDGKRDLWVINGSDGTDPVNLTKGEQDGSDNYEGSWAPMRH